jgi:SecD/SecF fusion protein
MKRLVAFIVTVIASLVIIIGTVPNVLDSVKLGLDLKGGFEILYEASPLEEGQEVTYDALVATAQNLQRRADVVGGVGEPEINPEGSNRIRVRIAGVENIDEVRKRIKDPAVLTFRSRDGCEPEEGYCRIELRGTDFKEGSATVAYDELNRPIVNIEVKEPEKFYEITDRLSKKPFPYNVLAIMLDEDTIAQPEVNYAISGGKASITGQRTAEEAKELAQTINLGALPLKLTEKYIQQVDATLGKASLERTMLAGIIGSIVVLIFMAVYYRLPGLVASFTLIVYIWLLLIVFNLLNATLTLPGIAAFVLGIGMAVDANIITYERFREELRVGKSVLSSVRAGSRTSLRTIVDANLTTVIAAAVLFSIGQGAIKGFALTLIMSIVVSMITNVFLSRLLILWLVRTNKFNKPEYFGVKQSEIMSLSAKGEAHPKSVSRFDFARHSYKAYSFSIAVTLIGVIVLIFLGMNYGVDFKAGTTIDVLLNRGTTQEEVDKLLAGADFEPAVRTIGGADRDRITLRFEDVLTEEDIARLEKAFDAVYGEGAASYEENTVDPVLAFELRNRALYAILAASVFILVYVLIRFEWRFAVAAIIALLHDAFMVISVFSIFRLEVNLTFIAAILTIVGYSINDTIVIFDRIRDNLRFAKLRNRDDLKKLVNDSLWQTLSRTVNTLLTCVFTSVALMIFGSPSIFLFSLAITVGLVFGGYSSIFIATPIWYELKLKTLNKSKPVAAE